MPKRLAKIVQRITHNLIEQDHIVDSFQRENYTLFLDTKEYIK